jgi:anhydro-N-acetylmuramic acid kinase
MSGTSTDGVDGVLADFSTPFPAVVAMFSTSFAPDLRANLLALNQPATDEIHTAAQSANALAGVYASVVHKLLNMANLRAKDVRAIGAHGQTVRHCPPGFVRPGDAKASSAYTVQIQNPALLAERTGIAVVADFRSRDIAAGGQGAPLVPAFHQAVFAQASNTVAVVNIGGISNVSLLSPGVAPLGFDTGPGNVLMDMWCEQHTGQTFDADGTWAASGRVDHTLLDALLAEPYFAQKPPKSTGRDLFHRAWLQAKLQGFEAVSAVDVQATLTELTARCIRAGIALYAADATEVAVCGGGAHNGHLMRRLGLLLPNAKVHSTAERGIHPMQVEALAFAWLAKQCIEGLPGNLPSATGAAGPRVLGAIYPA